MLHLGHRPISYDEATGEIVRKGYYHLGMAVANSLAGISGGARQTVCR